MRGLTKKVTAKESAETPISEGRDAKSGKMASLPSGYFGGSSVARALRLIRKMMQVEIDIGTKYNTVSFSLYEVTRILEYCVFEEYEEDRELRLGLLRYDKSGS